jgi:hypothetical protein
MPDLRDLLEGAVDSPVPFDLDAVGRRVDSHHRRRRVTTVGTAVAVLAILVAATSALLGDDGGDKVDTRPANSSDGTATTVGDGTATTDTGTDAAGPGDERACSADDVAVTPLDEQLGHQGDFFLDVAIAASEPSGGACAIDNDVTFTLRDPDTDEALAIDGNPATVRYTGTVGGEGDGSVASSEKVTWTGCASVSDPLQDSMVLEAEVDGIGTYRGTVGPVFCREVSGGSIMRALDPDVPATDLPTCTQDDVVPLPVAEGLTAQQEVFVDVRRLEPNGVDCGLDATATLTFLDPATLEPLTEIDRREGMMGETVPNEGNRFTVRVRGSVGPGQLGIFQDTFLGWDGCLAGAGPDDRGEVVLRAEVEGFPPHDATVQGPICEDPGSGSVIFVAPATWEASRLP